MRDEKQFDERRAGKIPIGMRKILDKGKRAVIFPCYKVL
jgi:hypothetical protein